MVCVQHNIAIMNRPMSLSYIEQEIFVEASQQQQQQQQRQYLFNVTLLCGM
jgi:hypothetical protein